jgi:hypothetical protein
MGRHAVRMGETKCSYRNLVGKSEGKKPLERPRRRLEDTIRIDLQKTGCEDVDWIHVA